MAQPASSADLRVRADEGRRAMESSGPRPIVRRRTIGVLLVVVASHTGFAILPAASQTSAAPSDEVPQSLRTIGAIAGRIPREATLTPRTPAGEAARMAAAKGAQEAEPTREAAL